VTVNRPCARSRGPSRAVAGDRDELRRPRRRRPEDVPRAPFGARLHTGRPGRPYHGGPAPDRGIEQLIEAPRSRRSPPRPLGHGPLQAEPRPPPAGRSTRAASTSCRRSRPASSSTGSVPQTSSRCRSSPRR
jgi:hypothetical protein